MRTLFLDFDGVLHPEFCHESKHFCCLPALAETLEQVQDCEIVITSTWRLGRSLEDLRSILPVKLASKVVGVTPRYCDLLDVPPTLVNFSRHAECWAWLSSTQRSHLPWLAIDDRPWLFKPFCPALLLVDGRTGFTREAGRQLLLRLGRM